jgi:arginyl-tRNA synthetase
MFEKEQRIIETKIRDYCQEQDIPLAGLKWQAIPFAGEWGLATSFFQTAADEARAGKGGGKPVPQRAQEIAEGVLERIGIVAGISRVETVKGYLNLYFSTSEFARRVVEELLIG